VRHFDCASAPEIALVRRLLPDAAIHFMHPVKSRPGIRAAWAAGVRDFSLDHSDELAKIRQETSGDGELGLFVRLAMPRGRAAYDLSGKFGASVGAGTAGNLRTFAKVAAAGCRPRSMSRWIGRQHHLARKAQLSWSTISTDHEPPLLLSRASFRRSGNVVRTAGMDQP
jgi:diaminopimelate decarboxylase